MVKDINPGSGGSNIYETQIYDGRLFFSAADGTYGYELWVSDGTEAGTHIIKDINPGLGAGYIDADEDD